MALSDETMTTFMLTVSFFFQVGKQTNILVTPKLSCPTKPKGLSVT